MKNILGLSLLLGVIMGGTMAFSGLAMADDDRDVAQVSQDASRVSDSSCATASGSARAGAQVTRESNAVTIVGVGSGAAGVDTRNVQGSITRSELVMLRISWGSGRASSDRNGRGGASDRGRGVASPPGAPEMPGDVMFGSGFLVLGLGLLLYRKRLW